MKRRKKSRRIPNTLFTAAALVCIFITFRYTSHLSNTEKKNISENVEVTEDKVKESTENNEVETAAVTENKPTPVIQDISSFIPEGWKILDNYKPAIAEGDLNEDGINDKAFIIEEETPSGDVAKRKLIIVFGNSNNGYDLSIESDNAVLLSNEGGAFGDPFEDISIDRGSVLLKFMGGASQKWGRSFRFRYQDNGWYLIGFTEKGYELVGDAMVVLQDDYNLITGDYVGDTLENGKVKTIKKNIGVKPLLNLKDFNASEYSIQSDT